MKKIVFSMLLVCIVVIPMNGQEDSLKSFEHRWSTELNFNPFNGNLTFNNAINQIKLRYFEPNNVAWRFALTVNYLQDNNNAETVYGTNPHKESNRKKSLLLGLNIGREKHFQSSRRLSPYIGGELAMAIKSSSNKIDTEIASTEITGAWQTTVLHEFYDPYLERYRAQYITSTSQERGFWSVGANIVIGFDFYVSRKLYFGYELLFGLNYISYSDIDITNTYKPGYTAPNDPPVYPDLDDESWSLGPKLVNGIRFGFVF